MTSDIHALSGAYAVDALDANERAEFEKHLATCASCRAEVDDLRAAAGMLAELTSAAPPPRLRDAVLADIHTVRPLAPRTRARSTTRRRRWLAGIAAAAAVLAVLGAGTTVWQPWHRESTPSVTLADRVIHAPDVQRVDGNVAGGGSVSIYRSVALGRAVAVTHRLPAAPPGRAYELWLQDARGTMQPAGLLAGGRDIRVALRGDAGTALGAGVTVEPAGGSPQPTTTPVALVSFG
jgi:anti-sigma-K factor RskA